MITKFTLKNIKGFGDPPMSLDVEIKSDKINLLIAPNGFGKSSLAVAFESVKPSKLAVEKENKYKNNENLDSSLSLTIDGVTYSADINNNTISPVIEPHVISTGTKVHTFGKSTGAFHSVSGYLDIEDIELSGTIPPSATVTYQISNITSAARTKRGVLKSFPFLFSDEFVALSNDVLPSLDKFSAKKRIQIIDDIWTSINSINGTAEAIVSGINDSWFDSLESEPEYIIFKEVFKYYLRSTTRFDSFSIFFQLLKTYEKDKQNYKRAVAYCRYKIERESIDNDLKLLNSSWNEIRTSNNDGKLIVHFPRANQMSNGQRDVLTMVCELIKFRAKIRKGKKYLLIMDEVFDYLDDANIMAAQYFLSQLSRFNESEVYVCILTHLSTDFFRSYVFNKKKLNEVFLKKVKPCASAAMKSFIAFREGLDRKNNPVDESLYNDISYYLLHYTPLDKDISVDLENRHKPDLKSTWGRKSVFHKYVIDELNKYFASSEEYDPYAVAVALRLKCEKNIYDILPTQELKDGFIDKWKTVDKFDYCEDAGYSIPSAYYIVAAIHNETDHVKRINGEIKDTPMIYKLQNEVIRAALKGIFKYDGTPIPHNALL